MTTASSPADQSSAEQVAPATSGENEGATGQRQEGLLYRLDNLMTIPAAVATLAIMVLTTMDASGRYLLNEPVQGAVEATENYLLIAAVFFAVGWGYRQDAYVRVTFIVDRITGTARHVIDCVAHAISLLAGAVLVYATVHQALDTHASGVVMSGLLAWPLWPAYTLLLLGVVWMTFLILMDAPRVLKGVQREDVQEIAVV